MIRTLQPAVLLDVVTASRLLRAAQIRPETFEEVFRAATLFAQRPEPLGFMIAHVPGKGRWVSVFSTLEKLGAAAGECDWMSLPGAEVLERLPPA